MQPLVFSILASQTPPKADLHLVDERLEPIPYDDPTDLVAITVETYTARNAYQIAGRFRRRGVQVIMGGFHPTFLPDEALQHADAVVAGDAEGLWPQVVKDADAGTLREVYRQQGQPPLTDATPDRRIFRGKRYAPVVPVQFGRGCRFACDFCSIHAFYGNTLRQRPVEEVAAEIEAIESRNLFIVDDNLFADVAQAEEFCRALIPLKISWSCQVSLDVARHDRLLKLLQQSGCRVAVIGFESLDRRNLVQMNKGWNATDDDYATAIRKLRDHGIMIYGTFVFGYDHDTPETFDAAVDFALRNRFCLANFNPLTPTPGTPLYRRLEDEGRLIYDRWWLDPTYRYGRAMFHPRGMTAEQLTDGCYRARLKFNRYGAIFRRALDFKTNCRSPWRLGLFLAANLISRREIHRKQGLPLGDDTPLEPVEQPA